ncbi:serglycin isoform X2 [Archocentrus centrarchus]|uniref:serglycin isoform X2 n=1 Tax=Archocentrus centrarchus TaxID=63155 RepID=UPI0011E9E46E|nr:neurofilament medium polypeptide-like isoform X2 [Archocentrus centrarchus]
MRLILLLVISCLAIYNANGAPRTAVYKFVKCSPDGDQANCVTQQSPEMEWSPDLPSKLPASAAQDLEAEPVEDESPMMEENDEEEQEEEEETEEDESPQNELPVMDVAEEGSGGYEGSAGEDTYIADKSNVDMSGPWRLFSKSSVRDEAKPAQNELKEDHLLQL